jgi:hypothetical protein
MMEESLKWRAAKRPQDIRWVIVFFSFSSLFLPSDALYRLVKLLSVHYYYYFLVHFSQMFLLKQKQVKCTEQLFPIERVKPWL